VKIVTSEQMREIESRAESEFGITARTLMENAGEALLRVTLENPAVESVLVLAGPGNNGGDGLAAARLMHEAGRSVSVMMSAAAPSLRPEPLAQYRRAVEAGVKVMSPGDKDFEKQFLRDIEADTILDALLGTGASGAPSGEVLRLIELANISTSRVISVDVPSGVNADTGDAAGEYVIPTATAVLGLPKPYLFQSDGLKLPGVWRVVDIGIPTQLADAVHAELVEPPLLFGRFPNRSPVDHKRSAGTVLVIAGSHRHPGAATLAALGAYRAGAGLVTLAGPDAAIQSVRANVPECPLLEIASEGGFVSAKGLDAVVEEAARANCIVVGPGLGRGDGVRKFLEGLFERVGEMRWVVDADALYLLPDIGAEIRGAAVLTPHEGEAGRLLGITPAEVAARRFDSAASIAKQFSKTVLLKGPYSLICDEEHTLVNSTGSALLATAGTGDVLSGAIGAYLAMDCSPTTSATLGAFVHGLAANRLADTYDGAMGATARDIAAAIPAARVQFLDDLVNDMLEDDEDWNDEDYDEADENELDDYDEADN
jgi:NAD(P)H-hydrate epimerase